MNFNHVNKKNILKITLCFLQINCNLAFCGTSHHKIPDHNYIEYSKQYDCVVEIIGDNVKKEKNRPFSYGSAVIINKNWILTAAHVVDTMNNARIKFDDKYYYIEKVIKNKNFKYGDFASGGDIALCKINEEIKLDKFPELFLNHNEIGKECSISGFGLYGKGNTNKRIYDHQRRAGTNKIISTSKNYLECDLSINSFTRLEFIPCVGDSGGGLFIDGKLAGINSFITGKGNALYGDSSFHTRISNYSDWIYKTIKSNK